MPSPAGTTSGGRVEVGSRSEVSREDVGSIRGAGFINRVRAVNWNWDFGRKENWGLRKTLK